MEKILKKIVLGIAFVLIGGVLLSILGIVGFVVFRFFKGLWFH